MKQVTLSTFNLRKCTFKGRLLVACNFSCIRTFEVRLAICMFMFIYVSATFMFKKRFCSITYRFKWHYLFFKIFYVVSRRLQVHYYILFIFKSSIVQGRNGLSDFGPMRSFNVMGFLRAICLPSSIEVLIVFLNILWNMSEENITFKKLIEQMFKNYASMDELKIK